LINSTASYIDAVDRVWHTVGFAWNGAKALGEGKQAIHRPSIVIKHESQCMELYSVRENMSRWRF
jgi:hypothetical protein